MLEEKWEEIREFPQFAVSNYGEILNLKTKRYRRVMSNAQGVAMITVAASGRIWTRGLALLVAGAFLPNPEELIFRTPINLDGDRMNCRVDNLLWRPRWFSVKYHRQFFQSEFHHANPRLELLDTGEEFIGVKEPAIKYGLHYVDIFNSAWNETPVFPTRQTFRLLDEYY